MNEPTNVMWFTLQIKGMHKKPKLLRWPHEELSDNANQLIKTYLWDELTQTGEVTPLTRDQIMIK